MSHWKKTKINKQQQKLHTGICLSVPEFEVQDRVSPLSTFESMRVLVVFFLLYVESM